MSGTAMTTRTSWYLCFEPHCYCLTCCNQYVACSACNPKNDFWGCPMCLYVPLQVLSFPMRVLLGGACGLAAGMFLDAPRLLCWCCAGCGTCVEGCDAKNGCRQTPVAGHPSAKGPGGSTSTCRYYFAPTLGVKANAPSLARGQREITGCAECCRAVCCVVAQDRTEESVCFETCETCLAAPHATNLTYTWNPQHTQSEQRAKAEFAAIHAGHIHGGDVPATMQEMSMRRGDEFA